MGQYLNSREPRSELQQKIDAELRAKAEAKAKMEGEGGAPTRPDGVDDAGYIKGTKKTTSLAWVWAVLFLAAVCILIWFIVITFNQNAQMRGV